MNHKTYFLSTFLLYLISFSCQKTDEQPNLVVSEFEKNALAYTEAQILENNMQWVSFIVAEILYDDEQNLYRDGFVDALDNNQNIIKLNDLIGEQPLFLGFITEFERLFLSYYDDIHPYSLCSNGRPNASEDSPYHMASNLIDPFKEYRVFLLDENCIELYFPNELLFDSGNPTSPGYVELSITSTAHPLVDDAEANVGYRRSDCIFDIYSEVDEIPKVDNLFAQDYDNIIVARPFISSKCKYSEYNFNIRDFLAN